MQRLSLCLLSLLSILILLAGCDNGPKPLYDISSESYQLVDTDSATVNFPQDFKGNISVISFIYTNCPDVCPVITANMNNIHRELDDTTGIQFIELSFDPKRDTPSVLKKYRELYRLGDQFTMLTGDTATVHSVINKLDIVAIKTNLDSTSQSNGYGMKHSNKIYVMDENGRIRYEYMATAVPPKNVIEDINSLRNQ